LFGKGGLAYMHTLTKQTGKKDKKADAFMPELAMGAGYNITPELEATVTYAHAFGWKNNNPSFNTVLAGLDYHFSM
jgi:OOP family OmpA-OmpF porin